MLLLDMVINSSIIFFETLCSLSQIVVKRQFRLNFRGNGQMIYT